MGRNTSYGTQVYESPRHAQGMFDLDQTPHEQLAPLLDEAAEELLESAKWNGRPVDAVALARRIGLTVARDDKLRGRARYARLAIGRGRARGVIFVGQADRPERLQWAVAHELGEMAAHRVFQQAAIAPDRDQPGLREQLANELARRILLPRRPFEAAARKANWDLMELKETFPSASHELIARRMLDLPSPALITVFDHGRVHWRRTNQPVSPPPLSPDEQALMQQVHQSQAYHELRTDDVLIRAWPIHEPGWKREILRTEPR